MMALIWYAARPYALKIGLALALVLTILGILFRAKQAGRTQERMEQAIKQAKIVKRQGEAMARSPRGKKEVVKSLREGRF
jgi:high-affinity Fe2+/Pb2+ permease